MTTGTFYVGDVADGCPYLDDESCDLVITSPPYFVRNGYSDHLMVKLGELCGRVLKPGGRLYVIISQVNEKLDRPFDAQREILKGGCGLIQPAQTIIWVKSIAVGGWLEECPSCDHKFRTEHVSRGHFQPINSKHLMNYCWEYVIGFVKEPAGYAHPLNRKGIGVAYADKSNVKRWKTAADAVHCPGDILYVPYETTGSTTKKVHRHEFPLELARKLIVLSGIPVGSTVCDPFTGGGTTCFAAKNCGMHSIGNDVNQSSIDLLQRVWDSGINNPLNQSPHDEVTGGHSEEDQEHA